MIQMPFSPAASVVGEVSDGDWSVFDFKPLGDLLMWGC